MAYHVHSVISRLPISAARLEQFQKETEKDQTLQNVKRYIMNSWPKSKNDVDPSVKPYYMIRDDLSYVHNLILKDQRIVVQLYCAKKWKKLFTPVTRV